MFLTAVHKWAGGISTPLAVLVAWMALPLPAQAGLVGTQSVIEQQTELAKRARVQAFLERQEVRKQLHQLGVDPAEARKRVAALSDAEISRIHGRLQEMPAGQDLFGGVVGLAVFIAAVLLITDIIGATDVYTFVN